VPSAVAPPSSPALPPDASGTSASAGRFPLAPRAPCSAAHEHRRDTVRVSPSDGLILSLHQCRPAVACGASFVAAGYSASDF